MTRLPPILLIRCYQIYPNPLDLSKLSPQGLYSLGTYAVVIGKEDSHRSRIWQRAGVSGRRSVADLD